MFALFIFVLSGVICASEDKQKVEEVHPVLSPSHSVQENQPLLDGVNQLSPEDDKKNQLAFVQVRILAQHGLLSSDSSADWAHTLLPLSKTLAYPDKWEDFIEQRKRELGLSFQGQTINPVS